MSLVYKQNEGAAEGRMMLNMWRQPELELRRAPRTLRLHLHRGGVRWPLQWFPCSSALLLDTCCCHFLGVCLCSSSCAVCWTDVVLH